MSFTPEPDSAQFPAPPHARMEPCPHCRRPFVYQEMTCPYCMMGRDEPLRMIIPKKRNMFLWGWVKIGVMVVGLALSGLSIQGCQGDGGLAFLATSTITPTVTPAYTPTPALGIGSTMENPIDGMWMVYIPAGEFEMGSEGVAGPVHTVYLDAYWVYQTEVTNAMYAAFLNEMGNQTEGEVTWLDADDEEVRIHQSGEVWQVDSGYGNHPVVEVSWYGANAYCEWAGGALPTEAQWEKAARGGLEGMLYPWGDESPVCTLGEVNGAQFSACGGETLPVGSFTPNGYGLYDMAGNVWEWVADWYEATYYASSPYENPAGPESGTSRVLRGGSWKESAGLLQVASRYYGRPEFTGTSLGFRCVVLDTGF